MRSLILRIKKRFDMTIMNWRTDTYFSSKLAWFRFVCDIGGRIGLKKVSAWGENKKENWILNYLYITIKPIIEKYNLLDNKGIQIENGAIWVCWWTGIDTAPDLVKKCIKSVYDNASNHPVHLITKYNYTEYLTVPEYILEKYEKGTMLTAHFTDYLRVSLLEQYGGLWLDATIFCADKIPEGFFELPFFTCKSEVKKGFYLSDFQWTTFCLGGWKHNIFYQFIKEAFECYWQSNKVAIDYLFFDNLIYLAKENVPVIQELIENVPINNVHRDDLQAAMNNAILAEEFWNVIQEDTILYKLSWREKYRLEKEGKKTVYYYLINDL